MEIILIYWNVLRLLYCNIPLENINVIDYCVHCSNDVKFYSYRKDPKSLNRIFSFIFIK